jgi:hypothetical protein
MSIGLLVFNDHKRRRSGLVAAAALSVFCAPVAAAAIAAGPHWVWTKSWAEAQLRKQLRAVTALCVPNGPATRSAGVLAYGEFVCGFTLSDGSQYAIDLTPRTRTSWNTITMERTQSASSASGSRAGASPQNGAGQGSKGRGHGHG